MGTLAADVRFAFRMLRSNPGFTAIALAALALGIGANTAIFTVVDTVLLQPLPYPQPDRLMKVGRLYPNGHGWSNSIPKFMTWRHNDVFDSMALYSGTGVNIVAGGVPEHARALLVSQEYFRVFGVSPAMGRAFTPAEDQPHAEPVAVISHSLWQSRLGGDPSILGRTLTIDGRPLTVVGVLPKSFVPDPPADVWLPLQPDPNSTNQGHYLQAAGRLKPGVGLQQARAAMKVTGERFRAANPKWMDKNESVAVVPLREANVESARTALLILVGAVGFVLLIACANVANLLLARSAVRQREFAVRAAIGASRGRVIRQLLTESALLAAAGGALGFALGSWGVRALLAVAPGNIPRLTDPDGVTTVLPALDWRVAVFTVAIALGTAVLFGLFPALQISNPDLASTLKEAGGRSGAGRVQSRARSALVVSEVALALVLVIGASLLVRTFVGLRSVKPGIDPHHVLTLETATGPAYATTAKVDGFVRQVVRRVEALPGVEAVAYTVALPATNEIDLPFSIAGRAPEEGSLYNGDEQWRAISPHYFQAFHVPVLRGRVFRETDGTNTTPVVVINEAMAKKYWPKQDPIGQVILIGKGLGPDFDEAPRQVIGVVGTVRETDLSEADCRVMYVPQSQMTEGLTKLAATVLPLNWVIRTAGDPMGLRAAVEREFHSIDSSIAVSRPRTMEQVLAQTTARQSFNMLLLSVFAAIALLLAAIGVYGVIAYSVERRTQEMGIRTALGAARGDIFKLVIADGLKLTGAGVAVGLAAAFGVTRLLASLLFGVKPADPLTFAAVALTLGLVAIVASYIPARRAASIDPSDALRRQ